MTNHDIYEQFVQAFARHEPGLRAFVRSLLPDIDHTDEVMQETSLVLWRKYAEFDPTTNFLNWACTVARFEVLKFRRRLVRDRHVFQIELLTQLAEDSLAEAEQLESQRRALHQCIEKLPTRQRTLVRAAYAHGTTIKDVASQMGQSATSLYKALNRIRRQLLQCIDSSPGQEGSS